MDEIKPTSPQLIFSVSEDAEFIVATHLMD